jgi:2-methylisocitrate lyase-like PEP mutase family enzyme
LYQEAGADGAFVPGLTDLAVAKQLSQHCSLPLNLMGWPEAATVEDLTAAGVKRLSAGPALFLQSYQAYQGAVLSFLQQSPLADPALNYADLHNLFS